DATVVSDPGRTETASRGGRERKQRRDVQADQLQAESGEALGQQCEESKRERYYVPEEHGPRDRSKLGVAPVVQRADVDRERHEEQSQQAGGGRDKRHVEVVPQNELLGHQRSSISHACNGVSLR